jgi:hypothetical protein
MAYRAYQEIDDASEEYQDRPTNNNIRDLTHVILTSNSDALPSFHFIKEMAVTNEDTK